MRRVSSSGKIIEAVLREHARSAYEALRPPAPMADIRKLEDLVGAKLPQALVSSLRVHDGIRRAVNLFDCSR